MSAGSLSEIHVRRHLVDAAKSFLTGKTTLLDTCRRIDQLRHGCSDGLDPIFHTFIDIADEALNFPIERARPLYNKDYLARLDENQARYDASVQQCVRHACEDLIKEYGVHE